MSAAKTFIAAFCTGAVMLGTLYILVPEGGVKKSVQYAFCLCFLLLILSSAIKISGDDFLNFDTYNESFENSELSSAAAKAVFCAALRENDINYKKITVFTDKTDSGGISITKVYVYTAADYSAVNAVIGSPYYELVVINE